MTQPIDPTQLKVTIEHFEGVSQSNDRQTHDFSDTPQTEFTSLYDGLIRKHGYSEDKALATIRVGGGDRRGRRHGRDTGAPGHAADAPGPGGRGTTGELARCRAGEGDAPPLAQQLECPDTGTARYFPGLNYRHPKRTSGRTTHSVSGQERPLTHCPTSR